LILEDPSLTFRESFTVSSIEIKVSRKVNFESQHSDSEHDGISTRSYSDKNVTTSRKHEKHENCTVSSTHNRIHSFHWLKHEQKERNEKSFGRPAE
jgi:hypothetical protein